MSDALSLPPDDYEGVWFQPDELRQRNKELFNYGRRICRVHQGAALPLTTENFVLMKTGKFEYECKRCRNARLLKNARHRLQYDPQYLEHRREIQRRTYYRHRERYLQNRREYDAQRRAQAKRDGFTRALGAAS